MNIKMFVFHSDCVCLRSVGVWMNRRAMHCRSVCVFILILMVPLYCYVLLWNSIAYYLPWGQRTTGLWIIIWDFGLTFQEITCVIIEHGWCMYWMPLWFFSFSLFFSSWSRMYLSVWTCIYVGVCVHILFGIYPAWDSLSSFNLPFDYLSWFL